LFMPFSSFTDAALQETKKKKTHALMTQRVHAVTSHTAEYLLHWCLSMTRDPHEPKATIARLLLAAGRATGRVHTFEHALLHVSPLFTFRPLLVRALSLIGPSELIALRIADPAVADVILSLLLMEEGATATAAAVGVSENSDATATRAAGLALARVLDSLQVLTCSTYVLRSRDRLAALVMRHVTTLKELSLYGGARPANDDTCWDEALARCTRLESLAYARNYAPSAWLGLSQLHTLRGVDLRLVSFEAIATALPRLHTLEVMTDPKNLPANGPKAVAGLFDCLLPRLRSFAFSGCWPEEVEADSESSLPLSSSLSCPLPLLQELTWNCLDIVDGFSDARPAKICVSYPMITHWLSAPTHDDESFAASFIEMLPDADQGSAHNSPVVVQCGPLACVRDLTVKGKVPAPSDVALMLRAAPSLRKLQVEGVEAHSFWHSDPSFAGLRHPLLRSILFPIRKGRKAGFHSPTFVATLQQHHFPRLQEIALLDLF
jgi:hypothetical protein